MLDSTSICINISFRMIFFAFEFCSTFWRTNLYDFLLMDFGSGQYMIWRYIEYFMNKYVRSFKLGNVQEKKWKYGNGNSNKSHQRFRFILTFFSSFLSFLLHFFSLSLCSIPCRRHRLLHPEIRNDKLFGKKIDGAKYERPFFIYTKKEKNNGNWFDILIWVNALK